MCIKRFVLGLLICTNLIFFTACDPGRHHYDYEHMMSTVESIELIYYDNPSSKKIFSGINEVQSFDFEKMDVQKTLPMEQNENFISVICDYTFLYAQKHFDSPQGECIKINYKDGNFDIICVGINFSCQYDGSGTVVNMIGTGIEQNIVKEFFTLESITGTDRDS